MNNKERHLLFIFHYISEYFPIPSSDEGIKKYSEL